jgi:hypothetical protein
MDVTLLQQAIEQFLRGRGWTVVADGRVLAAEKDGEEALLGFLQAGEASSYVDRTADSAAALGAVLLDGVPDDEVARLQEAGVSTFRREELEDVVMGAWFGKPDVDASPFVKFLEGD